MTRVGGGTDATKDKEETSQDSPSWNFPPKSVEPFVVGGDRFISTQPDKDLTESEL